MANEWRAHVKKTMAEMKSKAKDGKVMLKDVLKAAGKTYKKVSHSVSSTLSKTKKHHKSKKHNKSKKHHKKKGSKKRKH